MVEIKILGGGREVGRVAVLVKDKSTSILLDYGVNFDEKDIPQLPLHIRPVEVDLVIISHAHLDHVGAAPRLYITGAPRVVSTKPTMDIARLLIIDFLRLNSYYLDYELREYDRMYNSTEFIDYGDSARVGDVDVRLYNAGHILGSSLVYLELPSGERALYTGDFNTIQTWTMSSADIPPHEPSIIIVESTYGSRNHPPRHLVEKRLVEIVEYTVDRGGVVLIPAFSVGRSQEVFTILQAQAPYLDIYVDGMSKDITEIYLKHKKFTRDPALFTRAVENVNFITDSSMRKKILRKPCVIVTPAGMLKGGPALYYLKHIYDNSRNSIILVSYQAINSNGHRLLENGLIEEIVSDKVKARVEWLDLSSHAGRDDIVKFISRYRNSVKDIVLIHGNIEDSGELSKAIKKEIGEDVKIHIPSNGEVVTTSN